MVSAEPSPAPRALRLPANLSLDPRRLVHVHTRFPGEVVFVASVEQGGVRRPLQYGDRVTKGQVVATIWSMEIGETKSELIEVLARLEIDEAILARLEAVTKGIVPEREILEARRGVESDRIALTRVERTLRSWRVSEQEIEEIKAEAKRLIQSNSGKALPVDARWAEFDLKAPIDGVVLEKNFNVGDLVDTTDDLLKIADLSRLQVLASVYEEDLATIRSLGEMERKWRLDLGGDRDRRQVDATFELVGNLIDPARRTAVLMGWIDNPDGTLAVGHFATAEITIPAEPGLVKVPKAAVLASEVMLQTADGLRFEPCPVEIVRELNNSWLVRGPGLEPGRKVVAVRSGAADELAGRHHLTDVPR